jgi:hypothetical protein
MNVYVMHHHIYHTNGFNPGHSLPPNLNSTDNWHLYHHTFTDPSFNSRPGLFDRLFRRQPPAPIYNYTFVYDPSMTPPPDTQKANAIGKGQLVEKTEETFETEEDVENPIDTEDPIEPLPPLSSEEENKKNMEETLILIQNGKTALIDAFAELQQKNPSYSIFKKVIENRQASWDGLAAQVSDTADLDNLNLEIEKNAFIDSALAMLLTEEAHAAEKNQMPIKNPLGLIGSYQDPDIFSYRLGMARENANLPMLSEEEEKEANAEILKIFTALEKKENGTFIHSLSKIEDRLATRGYTSVATHYKAMVSRFRQIDDMLSRENTDNYIDQWNAQLKEFDPQHQLLFKLYEADLALETFSDAMQKQLDGLEEQLAGQLFHEINDLTGFMKEKERLKTSVDVENYTRNIHEFIQKAKLKLVLNVPVPVPVPMPEN